MNNLFSNHKNVVDDIYIDIYVFLQFIVPYYHYYDISFNVENCKNQKIKNNDIRENDW